MHSKRIAFRGLTMVLLVGGVSVAPVLAQGTVIVHPPHRPPHQPRRPRPPAPFRATPLILKYQSVYCDITDGVAVTRVKQTFQNPLRRQIEGVYVYPLPDNVAVGDFNMTIGGKKMHGEVLDKEAARRTYEEIVRRTRDPGLLEYLNSRLYQAQIFPIPPNGQLEVELQYSQTLTESGGLGLFRHPLRAPHGQHRTVERLLVQVKVKSTLPLASVFCPSHESDISRPNDHEATVTYERSNIQPDRDFLVYYQRKDALFGLSVLTHRGAGEAGYFLLRISPRIEIADDQVLSKDIAFVIDTSGSMSNGKLDQVKRALKFCVNSLSPGDRFNIYGFSTEVHPFRDGLVSAESDIKAAAVAFTEKMRPLGGTNINQALLAALEARSASAGRPYMIVFMTDGEATVDVTNPEQILRNIKEKNPAGPGQVRFHVLGVGTQVNTHLLDKLAEATRGTRDYATEKEDLELKLSAFVTRLANPVLADIKLDITALHASDVYPKELPDVFRGTDLVVLGRYDATGHRAIHLRGLLRESKKRLTYEGEFPKSTGANEFLPRLWANRKVAYLLDQIRLHGRNRELVNEVVRLAKRHGIVTPYTSSLILEDEGRLARGGRGGGFARRSAWREADRRLGRAARQSLQNAPAATLPAERSGEDAMDASRKLSALKSAGQMRDDFDNRGAFRSESGETTLRHVGEKTFIFDGQRWIDTAWDGEKKPEKIAAFGEEYFQLLERSPDLAKYFALGERVIVTLAGAVYETTSAQENGP